MPYLESEQQDATRNVAECDSEKAAVTDAQETTANEQTTGALNLIMWNWDDKCSRSYI
jgi:hypothetical protein